MIFVTIGSQTLFDRLVIAADEYAATTSEEVVIQYGHSKHRLRHATGHTFLPIQEMHEHCARARVVIMHAGVGSVMTALEYPARIVLVPRRKDFMEAIDDHQFELADVLEERGLVSCVRDVNAATLAEAIERAPIRSPDQLSGESLSNAVARRTASTMAQRMPKGRSS